MRVIVQRVKKASVMISNKVKSSIKNGLLILVGIEDNDTKEDIDWIVKKIVNLRIFSDEKGIMNKSVIDINGEILVVSQFTLFASIKKGNRPSFIRASKANFAIYMYEVFCDELEKLFKRKIKKGIFGADMQVGLINDGPVTIFIDSKNRE